MNKTRKPAKCWFETDPTVLKIKSYLNKRHYSRQHKHISSHHILRCDLSPSPLNTRLTCPWVPWLVLRQHGPHDAHIKPTRCQQHLIGSCRGQRWEPMREGNLFKSGLPNSYKQNTKANQCHGIYAAGFYSHPKAQISVWLLFEDET